jgi:hypothetical protein
MYVYMLAYMYVCAAHTHFLVSLILQYARASLCSQSAARSALIARCVKNREVITMLAFVPYKLRAKDAQARACVCA